MPKKSAVPDLAPSTKKEVTYPVFALEACVRFSTAVKDLGGSRTPVAKSVLAKHVGLAESTPSFFQKISASKCFGIIDGWGSYVLTEQGRRYFYPTDDAAKTDAGMYFLTKPAAFSILINRFDGEKLPSVAMLGNILHQEAGIAESWKDRLASIFVRSAQFLGIIDGNGFLRYNASMNTQSQSISEDTLVDEPAATEMVRYRRRPEPPSPGHTVWAFPYEGGYIRLETPEKMPPELWRKLNAYVQILNPDEPKK